MVQPGASLLQIARTAIAQRLDPHASAPTVPPLPELEAPGASFVTLMLDGHLRGCMGQLEASRPLRRDVAENALAAAFRDPRFAPLSAAEWPGVRIEVSVLGPVSLQPCPRRADALGQIEPGKDGIILASGCARATFLPQVWEQLPEAGAFLDQLLRKAGITGWPPDMLLGRYRVDKFIEH